MRLYQASYHDEAIGNARLFAGSRRAAERALTALVRFDPSRYTPYGVTPIEVPTDRRGLLSWLKRHAVAG